MTVYIPEYVVGHRWEHLLHNQRALGSRGALLFTWSHGRQRALAADLGEPGPGGARGPVERLAGRCAVATRRRAAVLSSDRSAREVEVDVGPVAHGGHCVARHEGQVVFVRHALPGERVHARVTEGNTTSFCGPTRSRCWRARTGVEPPCPYAGPGRCGGCDLQHATLDRSAGSRRTSRSSSRLAGLDARRGGGARGDGGLGWRTRVR